MNILISTGQFTLSKTPPMNDQITDCVIQIPPAPPRTSEHFLRRLKEYVGVVAEATKTSETEVTQQIRDLFSHIQQTDVYEQMRSDRRFVVEYRDTTWQRVFQLWRINLQLGNRVLKLTYPRLIDEGDNT